VDDSGTHTRPSVVDIFIQIRLATTAEALEQPSQDVTSWPTSEHFRHQLHKAAHPRENYAEVTLASARFWPRLCENSMPERRREKTTRQNAHS
jgi:hypothetical protein